MIEFFVPRMEARMTDVVETWKPVVGYEGVYEVSDKGRVKRVARGSGANVGGILKRQKSKADGRIHVALSKKSKVKIVRIHVLVAAAFLGPRPAGHEINHKDGDQDNAHLSNLEYCTPQQNSLHSRRVLRRGIGESHSQAKLSIDDAREIIQLSATINNRVLAEMFRVDVATIQAIVKRRSWITALQ